MEILLAILSIFCVAITAYSFVNYIKLADKLSNLRDSWSKLSEKTIQYEDILYNKEDFIPCATCGKPYKPLMDPDYQPEAAICRDCLWKLHYDTTLKGGD